MLAGCLAVPLTVGGGLAVTAVLRSPLESDTRPEPVVATVGLAERLDSRATSITLVPADTFPVRSQTSGTVTGVSIVPGSPITDGSVVMAVDGLDVRAYVAAAPLYRDLATGMSGDDVVTAQRFLVARGLLATADGTVGAATVRAIRTFNTGGGRQDTDTLSVGSLLWVPEGSEPPQAVTVRVGDAIDPHHRARRRDLGRRDPRRARGSAAARRDAARCPEGPFLAVLDTTAPAKRRVEPLRQQVDGGRRLPRVCRPDDGDPASCLVDQTREVGRLALVRGARADRRSSETRIAARS